MDKHGLKHDKQHLAVKSTHHFQLTITMKHATITSPVPAPDPSRDLDELLSGELGSIVVAWVEIAMELTKSLR